MHADNGRGGHKFGQGYGRGGDGQGGQGGDGQGWSHGRRFGQNGGFGKMQNLSDDNNDQGSQL